MENPSHHLTNSDQLTAPDSSRESHRPLRSGGRADFERSPTSDREAGFDPFDSERRTDPDPVSESDLLLNGSTRAERQARAEWLVTELGRLAAGADDPHEQAHLRRTADSLVRLAIAFRS